MGATPFRRRRRDSPQVGELPDQEGSGSAIGSHPALPAETHGPPLCRSRPLLDGTGVVEEEPEKLADVSLPSDRVTNRHVRLDVIHVAPTILLLFHIATFGQIRHDAVRGPLGDIEGVGDVAQTQVGVVGDG